MDYKVPDTVKHRWQLRDISNQAMSEVIRTAEKSGVHTPDTWVLEGMSHHVDHALKHLEMTRITRDDLTHALTRIGMALWCFDHGVLDDNGPEGKGY